MKKKFVKYRWDGYAGPDGTGQTLEVPLERAVFDSNGTKKILVIVDIVEREAYCCKELDDMVNAGFLERLKGTTKISFYSKRAIIDFCPFCGTRQE